MSSPKLSVIIPAYNESRNIELGSLEEVNNYLKKQNYLYEVIVVDDGSSDNTIELIKRHIKGKKGFRLIENPHGGKAVTVITGMLAAKGDIVVFTDMDQATPLNQIEKFFSKFEEGLDVVIGSRGGRKGAPLIRKLTALGFSFLRNLILGLPLADTQCGFKAFTRKAVNIVFPKMREIRQNNTVSGSALNAGFDVEMLFYAKKLGLKIIEVPIDWHYVGTARFNLGKDALDAIHDMLRIRSSDIKGRYS